MSTVERCFKGRDLRPVLEIINDAMPLDRLSEDSFRYRVLLQENFDPELCIVSESEGRVVGFIYCVTRGETGYINILGVRNGFRGRGIGSRMLATVEEKLREKGVRRIVFSGGPRYLVPGVDVKAYPGAIGFFTKNGYSESSRESVSMSMSLMGYTTPKEVLELEGRLTAEGYSFQQLDDEHVLELLLFLKARFPWWYEDARRTMEKYPRFLDWFTLAFHRGGIIGYCQIATDGLIEHFGPFGVAEEHRNKGVGTVLFHRCLRLIQSLGGRNAWLAWGGGRNYSFYVRNGMSETRRFAVFAKNLGGE
ncbi:MAG: GNAT family N-acetyltransferase [Thermoproteota archaeon]